MRRWSALAAALAASVALLVGCGGGGDGEEALLADRVLRLGEDPGTGVQTSPGKLPPGLEEALKAGGDEAVSLPVPPDAKLKGSASITRADGEVTFFIAYELEEDAAAVEDALRGLLDETPWQVVGGQSSEGVGALRFQSTRSSELVGNAVVQPLPTSDKFDVTVERDGDERTLEVRRNAFTPVLGASFEERNGGVIAGRVAAGDAAAAGLRDGDRIRRVGSRDVNNLVDLRSALRDLGGGDKRLTSLVYVVQASPAEPITAGGYVPPEARPLPRGFPAPFLVRQGMIAVGVQWGTAPEGSSYQVTFVTKEPGNDVTAGLRQALERERWRVTGDSAEGFATNLEITSPDDRTAGAVSIDSLEEDTSYTQVTVQLQTAR